MDTTLAESPGTGETINTVARLAVTTEDRLAAFRLRYEVYVAEQGKPYPEADHDERLLSDELDPDGEIIVVESGGRIVGTVRANWFVSGFTRSRYSHVFELLRFPEINPAEIAVCSRLAASLDHRHLRARELLFETIYERGLGRSTRLCFATCASILLRMFRKYGFREYAPPIRDPVVGMLHRTVLVLDDLAHLERVHSPFWPMARQHQIEPQGRIWLQRIFDDYKARHADTK
jgi:predicted GNAT family N-acyltransferase